MWGPRLCASAWGRSGKQRRGAGVQPAEGGGGASTVPGPLRASEELYNKVHLGGLSAFLQSQQGREDAEVITGLEWLVFTFEKDVETQKDTGLLPFQGMDSECGRNPEQPPHRPQFPLSCSPGRCRRARAHRPVRDPQCSTLLLRHPLYPLTSSPGSQKTGLAAGKAETLEGSIERSWDDPMGDPSTRPALGPLSIISAAEFRALSC